MVDTVNKKPYDIFAIGVNFATDLDQSESVVAYTVACVNIATGADSKADIVESDSLTSPKVLIAVKGGSAGETHKITVQAVTSFDNYFEKDIFIQIAENADEVFEKRPNEQLTFQYGFTNSLEDGETVTSRTVTAKKVSDGSDATATVIDGSILSSPNVLVGVKEGVSGESYRITIKVETSNTFRFQQDITMRVK